MSSPYSIPLKSEFLNNLIDVCPSSATPCPVCREDWTAEHSPVLIRPCGHIFGKPCVLEWFNQADICPMDRQQVFRNYQPQDLFLSAFSNPPGDTRWMINNVANQPPPNPFAHPNTPPATTTANLPETEPLVAIFPIDYMPQRWDFIQSEAFRNRPARRVHFENGDHLPRDTDMHCAKYEWWITREIHLLEVTLARDQSNIISEADLEERIRVIVHGCGDLNFNFRDPVPEQAWPVMTDFVKLILRRFQRARETGRRDGLGWEDVELAAQETYRAMGFTVV